MVAQRNASSFPAGDAPASARPSGLGKYWRVMLVIGLVVPNAQPSMAQASVDPDLMAYARPPIHGFGTYSRAERERVSQDPRALELFEALLEGRVPGAAGWDSAVVIWWLAENGNPSFLPVFLDASRASRPALFVSGVYGLVRLSSSPQAARRLREIVRTGSEGMRRNTVALLAAVNDTSARSMLNESMSVGLSASERTLATEALRRPVRPRATARWPSFQPQASKETP